MLERVSFRGGEIASVYIPLLKKEGDNVIVEDRLGFAFETPSGVVAFMHRKDENCFYQVDIDCLPKRAPMMIDRVAPRSSFDLAFKSRVANVSQAYQEVIFHYSDAIEKGGLLDLMVKEYENNTGERPSPAVMACWQNELEQPSFSSLSKEMKTQSLERKAEGLLLKMDELHVKVDHDDRQPVNGAEQARPSLRPSSFR